MTTFYYQILKGYLLLEFPSPLSLSYYQHNRLEPSKAQAQGGTPQADDSPWFPSKSDSFGRCCGCWVL